MKLLIKNLSLLTLLLAGLFTIPGCVDKDFDQPVITSEDPVIDGPIITIEELRNNHTFGGVESITENQYIKAVAISSDEAGNFFRNLLIQDETGGIELRINRTDLYNTYPVGRNVFVRLQGLFIGDFNGILQVGASADIDQIPDALVEEHVLGGQFNQPLTPKVGRISDFGDADVSTLIQLENVEFLGQEVGLTYANAVDRFSENRTIIDCDGNTIILRSSGFSNFAAETLPSGNGTLTAVFSTFGATRQLIIRDLNDVPFTNERCTSGPVMGGGDGVAGIRALGSGGLIEAGATIEGIVISDRANGNFNGQNVVFQEEGGAGIVLRFDEAHGFNLNDKISVSVGGQQVSDFNGLLQISDLPLSSATVTGTGSITPNVVTTAEIASDLNNLESTLVQINDVTLSGSTYGDGVTINDATGSLPMFTFFSASFSGATVPTATGNIVTIVSNFNGAQANIRNLDDVDIEGGGGGPGPVGDPLETIAAVRDFYDGSSVNAPADSKISGIVISDRANGNITDRNLVIQNGDRGIVVRFDDSHTFSLGDEIEITFGGEEISEFNNLLQINDVPIGNASTIGTGSITPLVITVQELLAMGEDLESTLVKIETVTIAGGDGIWNGSTTVTDETGSIAMFTRSQATFMGGALPVGDVDLTGIVSQFMDDRQVALRNLDDIEQ